MRQLAPFGILFWAYFLIVFPALAQTGNIIETGDSVLDPDGDLFISEFSTGFSGDGYDVDEFEIKMFGIPIFGDGEALRDVSSGAACGVSDLAVDLNGYALYAAYDEERNIIFRLRVSGNRPSVQSYSIMIDTDGLIGNDDPNSNAKNPGFEVEVTLIHRFGVFIYDIDGAESCPIPLKQYDVATHQQKSVSSLESCEDEDYFIDFYINIQDLVDLFGIDDETELKFVGLTNISATCALAGSISDIGGVDDREYDGCFECAILDLVENQCPSEIANLCETCAGFPEGATETPSINVPVLVGDTQITGTAELNASVFIEIFSGAGQPLQNIDTQSNGAGDWTSGLLNNPLNFGDSIVVNALLPGKCQSGLNDAGLSFAIVSPNQPPQISGNNLTINYIENTPAIIIDDEILVEDDNSILHSASISISQNLEVGMDIMSIDPPPGVSVIYLLSEGRILLEGEADVDEYTASLRTTTFQNTSESPDLSIREIEFIVFDGLNYSQPFRKNLLVTEVNDPPVITNNGVPVDSLFYETPEDTPLDICFEASDVDNTIFYISSVSIKEGIGSVSVTSAACLLYTPELNYNGTIHLDVEVCDNGTPTLCDMAVVVVEVTPVNDPPDVIENGQVTETLNFSTVRNTSFDFCLEVSDIENNQVSISDVNLLDSNGSTLTPTSGLCFIYIPGNNFVGSETIEVTICDDGNPSECTVFIIEIEVLTSNAKPIIVEDTLSFGTNKNIALDFCVDATDPDGDVLEIKEINNLLSSSLNTTSGLCANYKPTFNFVGSEILEVIVCDDVNPILCDTLFVKIQVLDNNNPPGIFVAGELVDTVYYQTKINTPVDFCLPFEDPDNDNVNLSILSNISQVGDASFAAGLCLNYVPGQDQTGLFWLSVTACDSAIPSACSEITIGIDVLPGNSPPEIISNETGNSVDTLFYQTDSNVPLPICIETIDIDGDTVNIAQIQVNDNGGFYLPGSDDLCLVFVPDDDFVGTDSHTITVCDSGDPTGCDEVVIIIDVVQSNQAPFIVSEGVPVDTVYFTTTTGVPLEFCLDAIDPDGDPLLVQDFVYDPSSPGSDLGVSSGLCFNYVPADGFLGLDWVTATVCDDKNPGLCDEVVIGINVISSNTAPRIIFNGNAIDSIFSNGYEEVLMQFVFEVEDDQNDNLSIAGDRILDGDGSLDIVLLQNLEIGYKPAAGSKGAHRIGFGVCDDGLPSLCDSVFLNIDVRRFNNAPIAENDAYEGMEEDIIEGNLLANDSDPDDDSIIVLLESIQPLDEGIFDINETGDFVFTPNMRYSGEILFSYAITDLAEESKIDTAEVYIIIEPIDRPLHAFQALSPNGDGYNDFWKIDNIEYYPNNSVRIFDRWNNRVFEVSRYDNTAVKWTGQSNAGLSKKEVQDGTYYYMINPGDGGEVLSGMVVLKR